MLPGNMMMWYDDRARELTDRAADARDYYYAKYGREPNMVLVPPGTRGEHRTVLGMALVENQYVLPHHLYVGHVENVEELED